MVSRWLDAVRAEVSGLRALASVEAIAQHHRIQSSPGYDAAAAWLAGAVREAGLECTVEEARADGHATIGKRLSLIHI